ncbi:zinc finger, CCHC-type containing protein [Tanacetum coccineum]
MFGSDTIKLDRMDGMNFTHWKEKMKFLLTAFKVYYVLEGPPVGVITEEELRKREQDETLCRGYILSTLTDRLKKLMYTSEDFTLDQIQKHLRIEEETRIREKNLNGASCSKVNYVDSGKNNKGNDKKRKGTWNSSKDNKKDKKPLSKELHMASVTTNDDWWYDSDATTHVCNNEDLFKTYKETEDRHEVMMGDNHTSKVIGSGNMEIQFTSGKKLTLMNVLHVPDIRKHYHINRLMQRKKHFQKKIEVLRKSEELKQGRARDIDLLEKPKENQMQYEENLKSHALTMDEEMVKEANAKIAYMFAILCLYTYVYLLKSKDEAFEIFKIYKAEVENQRGKKIQILRSDRCGEYFCTEFSSYCESQGLIHQRISPYTPQQNGVAERKNRVLQDMINAIFFENKFRHDSTSTNEIVTQIPQDISSLDLNSFNKRNMAESSSAPRRSERARKERNLDLDFIDSQAIIFLVEGDNENNVINKIPVLLNVEDAPKTYKEAITSRNSAFWKEAIDDEMDSLVSNNTWELSDLPPDDILIVGTNVEGINETKKFMSSCFQMKDMNEVDTILGIKVKRHSGGYALNQYHYIDKIIDKFQHLNIKEAKTPYESSYKLLENNGRAVAQIEYASAMGCLMYATHCTRPDIAYAVCKLSRYKSNPSQDHWKAIGRVFGYLKRTRQLALFYDRFPTVVEGYSDASWITGSSDSKSITGWIFTLGSGAVCWGSKKQTCITHSTMEAEFLALAAAGKEAKWPRNMMLDIELWPQPMPAISLHCDSQSTLSRAYNKVYNGKSRHISFRHAYIKELISSGIITIEYIRSCKNLADPFTKGLPKEIVFRTTREMGLKPIE